ncbi:hypothetical protein [Methylocella silvestris]|uniref:hypothetical protein n=1 Tax=Methylocella silvestris TaxID=199596 RepID=UPI00017264E0|nr:hypothetical protein [Methylocella silvestris]
MTNLVCAEAQFPAEGAPLAVVLTLEDPDGSQPILQEMRQWFQARSAVAQHVLTVARLPHHGL